MEKRGIEEIVNEKIYEIKTLELKHKEYFLYLKRNAQVLEVPVIVLTAIMGTAAFSSLSETTITPLFKFLVGLVGILSAVLTALQSNLKFKERAAQHKVAADGFNVLGEELKGIRDLFNNQKQDEKILREKKLAQFVDNYPSKKEALIKNVDDVVSKKITQRVEKQLSELKKKRENKEADYQDWKIFRERDQVYNDVAKILQELDEQGEREVAFIMRKKLHYLHLTRQGLSVRKMKEQLEQLRYYKRKRVEEDLCDDNITEEYIEAVMAFQRKNELEQIDGIIGPYSKDMIEEQIKSLKLTLTEA